MSQYKAFRINHGNKLDMIQLYREIGGFSPEQFKEPFDKLIMDPIDVVVSCAGIQAITEEWIRHFQLLSQQIRAAGKKVIFVFAEGGVKQALSSVRSGPSLVMKPDLVSALAELSTQRHDFHKMQFIKSFVAATMRTLYIQVELSCVQQKLYMMDSRARERVLGDVSGVVFCEIEGLDYAITLSFPEVTFLKIMSRMLGQEFTMLTTEIVDGAAELLNIIFGQAKLVLNSENAGIKPSIPALVVGKTIVSKPEQPQLARAKEFLERGRTIVVPFESPAGGFFIEVSFAEEISSLKSR